MYITKKDRTSGKGTVDRNVETTDATVTTIDTVPIPTGKAVLISAKVVSIKDDYTEKGVFEIEAGYANSGGTVTLQGSVHYQHRTRPSGWNVTFLISGTNVLIQVTGVAATKISWMCSRKTIEV